MNKRRVDDSDIDVSSTDSEGEGEVELVDQEEIVNVDFDYFDLNPDVDFQGTKNFIRQLFGDDGIKFNLSGLADLILKENRVGTTIKTDGKEGDPFALLSVINVTDNRSNATLKPLIKYVMEKCGQGEFKTMLDKLINGAGKKKLGLIFSERLINMPVEVVPPMYKMLLLEMESADDSHTKYEFDYFLVISKVYQLVAPEIKEEEEDRKKKSKASKDIEMDYFHYEDLVLEENADYKGYYEYTNKNQETDSRRVFQEYGIDPKLSMMLISKEKLQKSVPEMEKKFPPF